MPTLDEAVAFHGHLCGGLMVGYRMASLALSELGLKGRSTDEEIVARAESENCALDALQVVTGCTAGKGNLFVRDEGKQAFTVGDRKTKKAVRVSLKGEARRNRSFGKMSPEEFFSIPAEELFNVREVPFDFPGEARVFPSVICSECGEAVMEPRARVKDGRIVCLSCSGEYYPRLETKGKEG